MKWWLLKVQKRMNLKNEHEITFLGSIFAGFIFNHKGHEAHED